MVRELADRVATRRSAGSVIRRASVVECGSPLPLFPSYQGRQFQSRSRDSAAAVPHPGPDLPGLYGLFRAKKIFFYYQKSTINPHPQPLVSLVPSWLNPSTSRIFADFRGLRHCPTGRSPCGSTARKSVFYENSAPINPP